MEDMADLSREHEEAEDHFAAEQPINFSLTALIDETVKKNQKDKEYASWRASSIGSCPRSHFYKRLGVKQTTPPNFISQRKFEVGNIFHEWIQDVYFSSLDKEKTKEITSQWKHLLAGMGAEQEIEDEELDLAGRYDMLVVEGGKRILYDIKTIHSQAFWRLEKSGGSVKDQWPHYWMQLGAYMLILKRQGNPVDVGRIILVSKDDLVTKEVSYFLTPELEKAVLDEVAMLNKHWEDKTLPECTCHETKDKWAVGFCPFADPDSEGYIEITPASGKVYKKKQYLKCCDESLFTNHKGEK